MYFIRFLRSCFRGLVRFLRTWTTFIRRFLSSSRLHTDQNMESDEECQYDSTWEDESQKETKRKNKTYSRRSRRNDYAARDMQDFRHRCPKIKDDKDEVGDGGSDGGNDKHPNLDFYRGRITSSPDGVRINEFHEHWKGDYERLEEVHSYIQWLFPLQEPGVNWRAQELTKNEIKLFRKDEKAKRKLVKSYRLMLDFYGIHLVDESTGEVKRAPEWKERFLNLNRHSHNNLRITRILKCLGTLGLQHYQAPLVKFFLRETLIEKQLPRVKQSVLDYFMFAVLDKSERRELVRFAYEHFRPREVFVWGPKKILSKMLSDCKGVAEQKEKRVGNDHNISDSDDDRNNNEENILSGDQGTNHKKKEQCNNAEYMETNQEEINLGSNDNSQCSLDDGVGNPNHQTEELSSHRNGNMAQTTDGNQSGSPEELAQSNNNNEENISSGDQGTNREKEADRQPQKDEQCNNAEYMETDQKEINLGSNDENQCSLDDSVRNPNHQTEELSSHRNGNVAQTTDGNQSGSPEELEQSNQRANEDSSISGDKSEHNEDKLMTPENMSEVQKESIMNV